MRQDTEELLRTIENNANEAERLSTPSISDTKTQKMAKDRLREIVKMQRNLIKKTKDTL